MSQMSHNVQQQKIVQQEMQLMYMYEDFNTVVGIANVTQAALEYFKDDREHPMVNINLNRLILQANLSNMIHMDQQKEADGEIFQATKKDLKLLYEKVMGNPDQYDERITNILKSYLRNLEPVVHLHQTNPLPTQKTEFNQVQKLVDGMNCMDDQVQKINKGELYQKKTAKEIKEINQKRKEIAQTKLSANFPKQNIINLQEEEEEADISEEEDMPPNFAIIQQFFLNNEGTTKRYNLKQSISREMDYKESSRKSSINKIKVKRNSANSHQLQSPRIIMENSKYKKNKIFNKQCHVF